MYFYFTLCDLINVEIVSHCRLFYLKVKSYKTPLKKNQDRTAFIGASYPHRLRNIGLVFFFRSYNFSVGAPPVPRLVNLVHAFNGVVVEQFKKSVEKLFDDSILLWRLLKLLFKILHQLLLLTPCEYLRNTDVHTDKNVVVSKAPDSILISYKWLT